jgi:hypothetical protein
MSKDPELISKTRSATAVLKDLDIGSIIQNELSKYLHSDEFGDSLKASINDVIAEMVDEAVQPLKQRIKNLEQELEAVKQKANDNEQYSRRSNVRIFGVKSPDTISDSVVAENCTTTVVNFCKNELGVDLNEQEIDRAHRVGRKNGDEPRAIIVKFRSHASKVKVMKAKKNLKGKPLYVNEDLTNHNLWLLKRTKEACKNNGYAYSVDGKIFVKISDRQGSIRIISVADLENF